MYGSRHSKKRPPSRRGDRLTRLLAEMNRKIEESQPISFSGIITKVTKGGCFAIASLIRPRGEFTAVVIDEKTSGRFQLMCQTIEGELVEGTKIRGTGVRDGKKLAARTVEPA